VRDNLILDFDAQGNPIGVTLEHDSQISDSSTIETLPPITPVLQPADFAATEPTLMQIQQSPATG